MPTPPATPARPADHLYWADWLRFLAAAVVLLNHVRMLNWLACHHLEGYPHGIAMTAFISLTQLGREAVIVFFVLSGMLVGGKTFARVRRGGFDAAAFAADRLSRIYVPLIPALLLTAAVLRVYDLPFHPARFLGCLFSVQGIWTETPPVNIPLWTLPYEVWCYVLTGGAAVVCARGGSTGRRLAAGAVAVVALSMIARLDLALALCWFMGAAGYWLRGKIRRGQRTLAVVGAAVAVAGTVAEQMNLGILPAPPTFALPPALAQLTVAAGALLFVACVVQLPPATRAGRWLEGRGSRLAAFSYTLYLTHSPVLYLLAIPSTDAPEVDGASAIRAVVWTVASLAAAWGLAALFEARTPAVRQWLRARFAGENAPGFTVLPQPVSR